MSNKDKYYPHSKTLRRKYAEAAGEVKPKIKYRVRQADGSYTPMLTKPGTDAEKRAKYLASKNANSMLQTAKQELKTRDYAAEKAELEAFKAATKNMQSKPKATQQPPQKEQLNKETVAQIMALAPAFIAKVEQQTFEKRLQKISAATGYRSTPSPGRTQRKVAPAPTARAQTAANTDASFEKRLAFIKRNQVA